MSSEIHYFLDSISSKGYVDYYDCNFKDYKILKLENYPIKFMEGLIDNIKAKSLKENLDIEIIHSCLDNSASGIIIPKEKMGIINIPPYCSNPKYNYDLTGNGDYFKMMSLISKSYYHMKNALAIHDEWEKVYIANTDFNKLNSIATKITNSILEDVKEGDKGENIDRFFGAGTTDGPIDYIEGITRNMDKRMLIKGRPGTGKSTFMKKIAKKANKKGYDTITYHCAFDPDSVDMIVINELNVCIFDSTAPHEYFKSRYTDEIIDVYAEAVIPLTDENNDRLLTSISEDYKQEIENATGYLVLAKKEHEKAEGEMMNYYV